MHALEEKLKDVKILGFLKVCFVNTVTFSFKFRHARLTTSEARDRDPRNHHNFELRTIAEKLPNKLV